MNDYESLIERAETSLRLSVIWPPLPSCSKRVGWPPGALAVTGKRLPQWAVSSEAAQLPL